jgi:hypothetical protein
MKVRSFGLQDARARVGMEGRLEWRRACLQKHKQKGSHATHFQPQDHPLHTLVLTGKDFFANRCCRAALAKSLLLDSRAGEKVEVRIRYGKRWITMAQQHERDAVHLVEQ